MNEPISQKRRNELFGIESPDAFRKTFHQFTTGLSFGKPVISFAGTHFEIIRSTQQQNIETLQPYIHAQINSQGPYGTAEEFTLKFQNGPTLKQACLAHLNSIRSLEDSMAPRETISREEYENADDVTSLIRKIDNPFDLKEAFDDLLEGRPIAFLGFNFGLEPIYFERGVYGTTIDCHIHDLALPWKKIRQERGVTNGTDLWNEFYDINRIFRRRFNTDSPQVRFID